MQNEYIKIQLQNGPVKEVGVNGCQIDDVLVWAADTLVAFQTAFPCKENVDAIACIQGAINALEARRLNRESRGVEGLNKP